MARPPKLATLMPAIKAALASGTYIYSSHASERMQQRMISNPEVLQVLSGGHHEKAKDSFDEAFQAWNYAIRGKTVDKRELRIAVSFDPHGLLIITVIDLKA